MLGFKRKWQLHEAPVYLHAMEAQYTGRGYTRLSQVSSDFIYDFEERRELHGIPSAISELDISSYHYKRNVGDTILSLKTLNDCLTNYEARRSTEEYNILEEQGSCAKIMVEYGVIEVLQRFLMMNYILPEEAMDREENDSDLPIKSLCLEIMSKIITTKTLGEEIAKMLSEQDDFVSYVFTLLAYDATAHTAAQMIEDVLQARRSILNLTSIPSLRILVDEMDDRKLANFCRILAVTISDLDVYENKSSLFAQNKQKRSRGFVNVRDINQELLLGYPDLLARLVDIATTTEYQPRSKAGSNEVDCWMEWIEDAMTEAAFIDPSDDDLDNFIGGITEAISSNGPMYQQPGLAISMDLILRVQVIYVLGLFLVGKHRKKVQRRLAELKLIPGLSQLFDNFMWKCPAHRNTLRHRLRGHNASCECSPEVALKIQFLRLVHSFCDHSDHKHLLLSTVELEEIKRVNNKAASLQIDGLERVEKDQMCRGSKGLLTKIVDVMKKEPTASTFRFWLARAIESYLRGNTSYCDQIFLLRRGLLEHVTTNLVEQDISRKEIIQSSFDLMGELVKFNVDAFKSLDKVFNSRAKFDKFLNVMHRNLVDSNMFIRGLILSLEHCITTEPVHSDYAKNSNMLLQHISKFDQQMEYLSKLINTINVETLTQENVSCLNTTLVFLMFANQKSELPKYLAGLAKGTSLCSIANSQMTGATLLKNFRELLIFWQDHYLHKDKDCSALEKSSRISFDYWKKTVDTLVESERESSTAIVHYISPYDFRGS